MKKAPLISALLACFVSACQDIVTRDGGSEKPDAPPEQTSARRGKQEDATAYPLTRTLTDSQNRQIEAVVLGKEGAMLAVERLPGGERFLIPMEKLGPFDQKFFEGLANGGAFSQVKAQVEKEARLAGRVAKWQTDLETARREADKYQLPLLLTVLVSGHPVSDELEKKFIFWGSEEFSTWASKNVALALVRVDDPLGFRKTTHMNKEIHQQLGNYGVNLSTPSVYLIKGDKVIPLDPLSMMNTRSAIAAVKAAQ